MKSGLIAAFFLATTAAGAVAAPATDAAVTAIPVEETKPVAELLLDIGYSLQPRADGTMRVVASAASGQTSRDGPTLPGSGPCEGYEPLPGCVITYNDGEYCTEQCGPILQVCGCVF